MIQQVNSDELTIFQRQQTKLKNIFIFKNVSFGRLKMDYSLGINSDFIVIVKPVELCDPILSRCNVFYQTAKYFLVVSRLGTYPQRAPLPYTSTFRRRSCWVIAIRKLLFLQTNLWMPMIYIIYTKLQSKYKFLSKWRDTMNYRKIFSQINFLLSFLPHIIRGALLS